MTTDPSPLSLQNVYAKFTSIFTCHLLIFRERVRAKDVRLEDRVFLVTPEPPEVYVGRTRAQIDFATRRAATVV